MERMKRGGKDERREPRFNPYFSFSILHGWEGILSSLGGFREEGGMRRGEGRRSKSQRTTGKQEAQLQQIPIFYQYFSLGDVTAVPRRPIKVNDRGLFSHQSSSTKDSESVLMLVKNYFPASTSDP